MTKHPAVYSDKLIPIFTKILLAHQSKNVLDPFAGTGKLALVKNYGFEGQVICNEIEPEWANSNLYPVDVWHIGDAADMSWASALDIWAICTSVTYGNRMADHHNAKDGSKRITYKHYLGRDLNPENTGQMQWGVAYREKHKIIYKECFRILRENGIIIINVSNHIRKGKVVDVSQWHYEALISVGFKSTLYNYAIETPRMRFGKNRDARVEFENIMTLRKPVYGELS